MSVLHKFNANAMVNPTTPEDLLLLIREVNSELDNLNDHFDRVFPKPKDPPQDNT
jgi:hypothetical protein